MRWRNLWIAASFIVAFGGIKLQEASGRIVVGVSTVNVAFLPIYLTQDKGFFKDEELDVLVVMFNAGATNLQASSAAMCRSWPAGCRRRCLREPREWISKIFGRFPISCLFKSTAGPR